MIQGEQLLARLGGLADLLDDPLKEAIISVDRRLFIPTDAEQLAYQDAAVVTKCDSRGQPTSSASQPAIVARMLQDLELRPGLRVLEIGTGTGYNAGLLKYLVGTKGTVTSIEIDPDVAAAATAALEQANLSVHVVSGNGLAGFEFNAPYDRIIATASIHTIPEPWFEQLREGGLIIAPLRLSPSVNFPQAVLTWRKTDDRLSLVRRAAGGFMGARQLPTDSSPRMPALDVHESNDLEQNVLSVSGPHVTDTSWSSLELLSQLLSTSRIERVFYPAVIGSQLYELFVFLALALPAEHLISIVARDGVSAPFGGDTLGVWNPATTSAAWIAGQASTADRIEAAKDGYGFQLLGRAVDEWDELHRPMLESLQLDVLFREVPEGSNRWRQLNRGGNVFDISWNSG